MVRDLLGLVVIIALLALALGGGARWTRRFADLLWMFAIAPKTVVLAGLTVILIVGLFDHLLFGLRLVSPLTMTFMLAILPFTAVPLANWIARLATLPNWYRPSAWPRTGWKNYIFNERRIELGGAYEAPRAAQDMAPSVSLELEADDEPHNTSDDHVQAG